MPVDAGFVHGLAGQAMSDGKVKCATVDIGRGVQLYYEECGSGPVLLCVHGMWGTCRFFHKQIEGLKDKYRVIAPGSARPRPIVDDLGGSGRARSTRGICGPSSRNCSSMNSSA